MYWQKRLDKLSPDEEIEMKYRKYLKNIKGIMGIEELQSSYINEALSSIIRKYCVL